MLILTFNDNEEKAIKKVIAALANEIEFEVLQSVSVPMLSFPGLEIIQITTCGKRLIRTVKTQSI